ncbi:phage tail tape measure protein [Clostridium botulinum]|uniref:phage tail tape measure protein n=1 Tax=Clostridium botulinum TaxID=1491 RepID=UPI001E38848F|nr:phage tail tape measure protein [Clostridium botulinum]MCD3223936.1 phage tail tape measure protein [Clostridium botulinum C/D]MCD3296285.1 phage tail tape measure protein [Clostridium botulinum C/D]
MAHFARTAQYQGRNMKKVGRVLENTGKSMMTHIALPTAAAGGAMTKMAIDCESSFNGIRKTVDATEKQFKQLEKNFDNMSLDIPVDLTELHHYGELAGQLGVKAKDITKFSKTIAELQVSTNLLGEEGASSLAKFSNIMGMNLNNIDRLGSTIVHLGNNTATTEADIVAMAMRLAGAGKQVNLTESQVMALSATMSSLGIEAEAGGTAMSRVMLNINNQVMSNGKFLEYYAKICGTTKDKFRNIWKKDSIKGLEMFADGLHKFKQQGGNLGALLDTIGYKEVRVKDTLLRMSTSQGMLTKNVELGTKAWKENVALQNEANVRFAETAGQIQLMKNHLKLCAKTMGKMFLPYVKRGTKYISNLTDKLQQMSPEQHKAIAKFVLMASGISVAVFVIGRFTHKIADTIIGISKFIKYVRRLGGVMAFLTSPAMIVVAVLTLLAVTAFLVIKNWKKIKKAFASVAKAVGKYTGITKAHVVKFYSVIKKYVKKMVDRVVKSFKKMKEKIGPSLKGLLQSFKSIFGKLKPILVPILKFIGGVFLFKIMYTFSIITQTITTTIDVISGVVSGLIDIFSGIIDFLVGIFTCDWDKTWEGLKKIFKGTCKIIRSVWDGIIDFLSRPVQAIIDILDSMFHDKIAGIKKAWEGLKTFVKHPIQATMSLIEHGNLSGVKTDGSHAVGAKRIPYNGYIAELHEDERILTKQETMEYEQRKGGISIDKLADTIVVREESDIDKIANALFRKINMAQINIT